MWRWLKITGLVVFGLFGLVAIAGTLVIHTTLQSARVRALVTEQLTRALQRPVAIGAIHISLWSGITMHEVRIKAPSPSADDWLTVDAAQIHWQLLPLLTGRVLIDAVVIEHPQVWLQHPAPPTAVVAGAPPAAGAAAGPATPAAGRGPQPKLQWIIQRVRVMNGELRGAGYAVRQMDGRIDGLTLTGTTPWRITGQLEGPVIGPIEVTGELRIGRQPPVGNIRLAMAEGRAGTIQFHALQALVRTELQAIMVPQASLQLYGGMVEGQAGLDTAGAQPAAQARMRLQGVNAQELFGALSPAGRGVQGTVEGELTLRMEGTEPSDVSGQGQVRLVDGRLVDFPVLVALGRALELPALRDVPLTTAQMDLTIGRQQVRTESLHLLSQDQQLEILGAGRVTFDGRLDYHLRAIFAGALGERLPHGTIGAALRDEQGRFILEATVGGTVQQPTVNVLGLQLERILEKTLEHKLEKFLQREESAPAPQQ